MGAHSYGYVPTPAELAFIRTAHASSTAFLTICGGFMAPLQAGIFEGKTVTAPREMLGFLRAAHPGVEWLEKRWVRDGKLWTSGALLNGEDMVTAFALEHWGRGEGSLAQWLADLGAWPSRDVDYKDAAKPVALDMESVDLKV
jgi:transcriptional regulator GlxA family with amidase domain